MLGTYDRRRSPRRADRMRALRLADDATTIARGETVHLDETPIIGRSGPRRAWVLALCAAVGSCSLLNTARVAPDDAPATHDTRGADAPHPDAQLVDARPADAAPDACVPNCGARVCGNDGCGGSCGSCLSSQFCVTATEDMTSSHSFVGTCQSKCFNSNYTSCLGSTNYTLCTNPEANILDCATSTTCAPGAGTQNGTSPCT